MLVRSAIHRSGRKAWADRIWTSLAPKRSTRCAESRGFHARTGAPRANPDGTRRGSALIEVLEYRAIADLARAWRVIQPDLEQCGLVSIEYEGLSELAAGTRDGTKFQPWRRPASQAREFVLRAILNYLRRKLVDQALPCLSGPSAQDRAQQSAMAARALGA